jgi:hypothetical protein
VRAGLKGSLEPAVPLSTLTSPLDAQAAGTPRGLAGLSNLGNTCFMNSSLQCLSHTAPLARVFLSGAFAADLNRDNPLGNSGELAEAFGALMRRLWQARWLLAPARALGPCRRCAVHVCPAPLHVTAIRSVS